MFAAFLLLQAAAVLAVDLQVTGVSPPRNGSAPGSTTVSITFDRAVSPASITAASFRVYGRWSGPVAGTYSLTNSNRTVTFTRARPFSAGELVLVNLSHGILAADLSPLRPAGYAYSFGIVTKHAALTYQNIGALSNRINNAQTRIYGASASDLNEDGYLDLTTVNEVSADVRVALNLGAGPTPFGSFLAPQGIGDEASPNEPADFNNDGHADLCLAAVNSNSVWVLLGAGNGTFSSITEISVGSTPHGVAVLDVDGDGDPDIVNSNNGSNNLSLLVNNGSGSFAPSVFFNGNVTGEYGVVAGDMNSDGIMDVVVGAREGQQIVTMLGNGNGTFTAAGTAQSSGGQTWVVALGDLNTDGVLDATVANSQSGNGAVLLGTGTGTFGLPSIMTTSAHTVATDLGDLDGDGDLDWVLSSFGGGFWRIYTNNGSGVFTFNQQINAPSNPSCAVLIDFDNDQDLDLVLTDEIADVLVLEKNVGATSDAGDAAPRRGTPLLTNTPEPFHHETQLRFRLPASSDATLQVFDSSGREVSTTRVRGLPAGWNSFRFEGKGAGGQPLPSGVYYYKIVTPGGVLSDRMILVR